VTVGAALSSHSAYLSSLLGINADSSMPDSGEVNSEIENAAAQEESPDANFLGSLVLT